MLGFRLVERAKHCKHVLPLLYCSYTPGRIRFAFAHTRNVIQNWERWVRAHQEIALGRVSQRLGNPILSSHAMTVLRKAAMRSVFVNT